MAITQTDVDRLKAMYVSGILESGHGAKRVKFRSMDELKRALDFAMDEVNGVNRDAASFTLASFNASPGTEGA